MKNLNEYEKIFLDIGGHKGESVKSWRHTKGEDWHIVTFEPNHVNFSSYDEFDNHTLVKMGAWIEDDELMFYDARGSSKGGDSATNCFTQVPGMVGAIPGITSPNWDYADAKGRVSLPEGANTVYKLPCIDLAMWIKKNCDIKQKIVCKMDIEGAEYELIPHLLRNGVFSYIDEFFLECHSHRLLSGNVMTPWLEAESLGQNLINHALNACSILQHDLRLMCRHNQALTSLIIELGYVPAQWSPNLDGGAPMIDGLYMWDFNDMNNNEYPTRKSVYDVLNISRPEHVNKFTNRGWNSDRDRRHGLMAVQWLPNEIKPYLEARCPIGEDPSSQSQTVRLGERRRDFIILSSLGENGLKEHGLDFKNPSGFRLSWSREWWDT